MKFTPNPWQGKPNPDPTTVLGSILHYLVTVMLPNLCYRISLSRVQGRGSIASILLLFFTSFGDDFCVIFVEGLLSPNFSMLDYIYVEYSLFNFMIY